MKKQRKLIAVIMMLNMFVFTLFIHTVIKAEQDYERIEQAVEQSISQKDFYHYNLAYQKIMGLSAGYERDVLLSKLYSVVDEVWTKDISEIVYLFELMAKEKSRRVYDILETRINKADLKEIDRRYLLTEVNTWCRDIVNKEDNSKAAYRAIEVWESKVRGAFRNAQKYIGLLKLFVDEEYLEWEFGESKQAIAASPETLNEKYFSNSSEAYIGQGNSISLDLSKDTFARTVILRGRFEDLYINAPKGTVILEDVEAENVIILDVASSTLLMRGRTVVKSLLVKDRDSNANIVIEGNTTIASAEINSGVILEVNASKEVLKPFGEIKINLQEEFQGERKINLRGNFKESNIIVKSTVDLKVEGSIQKLILSEDAKNSNINIAEKAMVKEIQTEALVKVYGSGHVGSITGIGSSEVKKELLIIQGGTEAGDRDSNGSESDNTHNENNHQIKISWNLQGDDISSKVFENVSAGDINTLVFYSSTVEGVYAPDNVTFVIDCKFISSNSKETIKVMDSEARFINGLWYLPAKDSIQQTIKIKFDETGQYNLTIYAITD